MRVDVTVPVLRAAPFEGGLRVAADAVHRPAVAGVEREEALRSQVRHQEGGAAVRAAGHRRRRELRPRGRAGRGRRRVDALPEGQVVLHQVDDVVVLRVDRQGARARTRGVGDRAQPPGCGIGVPGRCAVEGVPDPLPRRVHPPSGRGHRPGHDVERTAAAGLRLTLGPAQSAVRAPSHGQVAGHIDRARVVRGGEDLARVPDHRGPTEHPAELMHPAPAEPAVLRPVDAGQAVQAAVPAGRGEHDVAAGRGRRTGRRHSSSVALGPVSDLPGPPATSPDATRSHRRRRIARRRNARPGRPGPHPERSPHTSPCPTPTGRCAAETRGTCSRPG